MADPSVRNVCIHTENVISKFEVITIQLPKKLFQCFVSLNKCVYNLTNKIGKIMKIFLNMPRYHMIAYKYYKSSFGIVFPWSLQQSH